VFDLTTPQRSRKQKRTVSLLVIISRSKDTQRAYLLLTPTQAQQGEHLHGEEQTQSRGQL